MSLILFIPYFINFVNNFLEVFGKKPISGIYKITDLITEECYIGQSVNIQ